MGPKAKPAAKKKEGNPENGVDLDPETRAKMFMLTCQSLQVQLGTALFCVFILVYDILLKSNYFLS